MKRKDIQELKHKSAGELAKLLGEQREALRAQKFELAAGKLKNVKEIGKTRKGIARIMTFMQQAAAAEAIAKKDK